IFCPTIFSSTSSFSLRDALPIFGKVHREAKFFPRESSRAGSDSDSTSFGQCARWVASTREISVSLIVTEPTFLVALWVGVCHLVPPVGGGSSTRRERRSTPSCSGPGTSLQSCQDRYTTKCCLVVAGRLTSAVDREAEVAPVHAGDFLPPDDFSRGPIAITRGIQDGDRRPRRDRGGVLRLGMLAADAMASAPRGIGAVDGRQQQ